MTDTMIKCLQTKFSHLLTVCGSQSSEIDVAILNALLQAVEKKSEKKPVDMKLAVQKLVQRKGQAVPMPISNDNKYQKQLHLALDWNRADLARKFIFTDEISDKVYIFIFQKKIFCFQNFIFYY
jgi:hypothetical protein